MKEGFLMFCSKCGANVENGRFCPRCGAKIENEEAPVYTNTVYYENPSAPKEVNTTLWLILGIISIFTCCLAGGIVTTVFAAKAHGCAGRNDYVGAEKNIKKAKGWLIATAIVGLITTGISFIGVLAEGGMI